MNSKNTNIVVILVVIVIAVVVVMGFFGVGGLNFFGLSQQRASTPTQTLLNELKQSGGAVTTLQVVDVTVGVGNPVIVGDTLTVSYAGLLTNGTVFDSSDSHGAPFTFTIGQDQVIQGWEQGLLGMREGGRRLLAIPPSMGYGANAVGPIPANSVLVFDVELVKRVPAGVSSASPAPGTPVSQ
ncbi:MAG: FKBP-type peptidyl-prolyl cis-trans isomerase [bacterium]|nr:FKBP-type peptidyl-prolyl cis-trans isomerase [bacterium]